MKMKGKVFDLICFVMVFFLVCAAIMVVVFTGGKSSAEAQHWIWNYVERPDIDSDAADSLLDLLKRIDNERNPDSDREFFDTAKKFANSSRNTIRYVLQDDVPVIMEKTHYAVLVHGVVIKTGQINKIMERLLDIVEQRQSENSEALCTEAGIVLLAGYQFARNGEDVVVGVQRRACWSRAIEILVDCTPDDKQSLLEIRDLLKQEIRDSIDWRFNELRRLK